MVLSSVQATAVADVDRRVGSLCTFLSRLHPARDVALADVSPLFDYLSEG